MQARAPWPARAPTGEFLIVGAGGLGCPALLGLHAAGAPRVTLIDHDRVDASNLQRQVLYSTAEVGADKVAAARWFLRTRASSIELRPVAERIEPDRVDALIAALPRDSCVLECSDSPRLKFAIHDAARARGLAVVVGGVVGWRGQVMAVDPRVPGRACYRCLFEAPPPRELAPDCAGVGVMGAVAGVIGMHMAPVAVSLLAQRRGGELEASAAEPLAGTLLNFDLRSGEVRRLRPPARHDCPSCSRPAAPPHRPATSRASLA